jgi:type II secretory pathway pseudopilin PulG
MARELMRRRRARGVTLIEIMISLGLVLTGLLVLFKVLSTAVSGSSFSSRAAQAHMRAASILEAIRQAPYAALVCLASTPAASWAPTCETTCLTNQVGGNGPTKTSSCIFSITSFANLNGPATGYAYGAAVNNELYDRTGTQYFINNLAALPTAPTAFAVYGDTYVRQVGDGLRTFEIAVSVGWQDDTTTGTLTPQKHNVTLVTGLFQ